MNAPEVSQLPNGIKIVTQNHGVPVTHIAVNVANVGSRFETQEDAGLTDFMSQALLRTSENRISAILHKDMAKLGADISASAGRDQLTITATTPTRIDAVVAAIADVINYPVYDFTDLQADLPFYEIDAMNAAADADTVIDQALHAAAFGNKGLGNQPLLTNIMDVTTPRMMKHHKKVFANPQNITISAVGVESHEDFAAMCQEVFMPMSAATDGVIENTAQQEGVAKQQDAQWNGASIRIHSQESYGQATIALGFKTAGLNTPKKAVTTHVLQRVLGGKDAVAQLNKITEQHKWVNSAQSAYVAYNNVGLFSIAADVESAAVGAYADMITKYVRALPGNITEAEVTKAKNQVSTAMLKDLQHGANRASEFARHVNVYGDVQVDAILGMVDNVSLADVQQVANELSLFKPALVTMGDATALPAVVDTFATDADRQKFAATVKA